MPKSDVYDWNLDYLSDHTPWETGQPARELQILIDSGFVPPGSAFEMGCGSGRNAVYLAKRGFQVTAGDFSSIALARARLLAKKANVHVRFLEADLCQFTGDVEPVDLVFDRSCYECLRHNLTDREGYLRTLSRLTRIGSKFLLIVRRSQRQQESTLDADPIVRDFEHLFSLDEWGTRPVQTLEGNTMRTAFLLTRKADSKPRSVV